MNRIESNQGLNKDLYCQAAKKTKVKSTFHILLFEWISHITLCAIHLNKVVNTLGISEMCISLWKKPCEAQN